MDSLVLEIKDVAATYGARRVFDGISLSLRQGETLVVAGHNGSGKSTLLRLLCGLQRPTAGEVAYRLNGVPYRPDQASGLFGWVAPDLHVYRELTALENLNFFARVRGLHRTTEQLEALLEEGSRSRRTASTRSTRTGSSRSRSPRARRRSRSR